MVVSLKPIRLYRMDRYALSANQKSKNQKKDTNYCSALGNQQNWFPKYINKKSYSTFSQPLNRQNLWRSLSKTTIHAKPQNLMSSTFKYSFTNAQDFCARKGNEISLSYYRIILIYGSEVLIHMRLKRFCNLYQGSSLPISTHTYDILSFASVFPLTYHKTLLLQKLCLKTYHWQRGFVCKYAWYFNKFQLWLGSLTEF